MRHTHNFDEQNFDDLIVGFIGEILRERKHRDKLLANCQICQSFSPSDFCAVYAVTNIEEKS